MNIIIYTANFGSFDTIKEQINLPDVHYICFTDKKYNTKHNNWEIIYKPSKIFDSRLQAKYFKIMSHECFPDADITIWIDSSYKIHNPDFLDILLPYITDNGFAVYKHPKRKCIYQEVATNMEYSKWNHLKINEQIEFYSMEGMPPFYGLWAAGLIIRRNNDNSRKINSLWWEQILKYSPRDQISLPYILWKHNLEIDTIDLKQYDETLYTISRHIKTS